MLVQTTYDYSFQLDPRSYPANSFYHGHYQFNKHYYGKIVDTFDSEEELDCARDIDRCDEVKTWVRNLVHESWDFRLPLPNGKFFYPDFVALLNDGRVLVVEYKGAIYVATALEKKNIGER